MEKLIRMIEKAKRDDSGFTLVELLIVVAIIGVLIAIIIPVMGGQTETARQNAVLANLRTINGAAAGYYAANEEYPGSVDDLVDEFLDEVPEGPAGVTYQFSSDEAQINHPGDMDDLSTGDNLAAAREAFDD